MMRRTHRKKPSWKSKGLRTHTCKSSSGGGRSLLLLLLLCYPDHVWWVVYHTHTRLVSRIKNILAYTHVMAVFGYMYVCVCSRGRIFLC